MSKDKNDGSKNIKIQLKHQLEKFRSQNNDNVSRSGAFGLPNLSNAQKQRINIIQQSRLNQSHCFTKESALYEY